MTRFPLRFTTPALLGLGLFAAGPLFAQAAPSAAHGVDLAAIDPAASPCTDFYQYANGKWLTAHPIPVDRASFGGFSELYDRNQAILHSIVDEASAGTPSPKGSVKRKVADFYRSGMDTATIEREGASPLAPEFARIDAVHDTASLEAEIAHLHKIGVGAVFGFGVGADEKSSLQNVAQIDQGGLSLPDRDYYTKTDPKSVALRTEYAAHVARMFALLGDAPSVTDAEAQTVLGLETQLATVSMTRVERRDPNATYHKMSLAEVNALTPGFTYQPYFAAVGASHPGMIIVGQPKFFAETGRLLTAAPLADWKTYLRWHLINSMAGYLSEKFVAENFAFKGTILSGVTQNQPRWKRVLNETNGDLGEGLGQLYVARAFPPAAKARALTMVLNLKAALRTRLLTLDWIGEDTRKQALVKLDKMRIKIGYPDHWRDYSKLSVNSPTYVVNVIAANTFEFNYDLAKLGKPVDRSEWGMTPPTVNAYYSPSGNEIVFPAGILQPPFYDPKADDASNYGGIGAVIGHEMTHGFDDQGRQFDSNGNLKDWWTAADKKNFQSRADLVAQQFDNFVAVDDVHVNGHLTLGEDIADLGGLKIAYLAFEKSQAGKPKAPLIGGFTPEQRFFLAFGQIWRENVRPEALRLSLATDPHAPNKFRVLGPIANLPEFSEAFPCPAGEAPKTARVNIW
ncbi:MAG: M13 family metallopeptidase [Janthinobacterium lividum]